MATINWEEFEKIELRAGTVVRAEPFPEARKLAIRLWIDFGPELGVKTSSAQITEHYTPGSMLGKQVVCVVNFPPRRIAGFSSEVLTTGMADAQGKVVLCRPDLPVPDGSRLY